ncbi:hypothetical protein CCS77_0130 [Campylobacter concisus]|uniref:Uncharacterized protein n=1 Tax=Campylobacter concisus TaxID=199 RepID=A0A2R4NYC0_9BACT|nr:hypothetical protein CCS77_0130 [Campylobacter concisus]
MKFNPKSKFNNLVCKFICLCQMELAKFSQIWVLAAVNL